MSDIKHINRIIIIYMEQASDFQSYVKDTKDFLNTPLYNVISLTDEIYLGNKVKLETTLIFYEVGIVIKRKFNSVNMWTCSHDKYVWWDFIPRYHVIESNINYVRHDYMFCRGSDKCILNIKYYKEGTGLSDTSLYISNLLSSIINILSCGLINSTNQPNMISLSLSEEETSNMYLFLQRYMLTSIDGLDPEYIMKLQLVKNIVRNYVKPNVKDISSLSIIRDNKLKEYVMKL